MIFLIFKKDIHVNIDNFELFYNFKKVYVKNVNEPFSSDSPS